MLHGLKDVSAFYPASHLSDEITSLSPQMSGFLVCAGVTGRLVRDFLLCLFTMLIALLGKSRRLCWARNMHRVYAHVQASMQPVSLAKYQSIGTCFCTYVKSKHLFRVDPSHLLPR
jgi:hypothetical protein